MTLAARTSEHPSVGKLHRSSAGGSTPLHISSIAVWGQNLCVRRLASVLFVVSAILRFPLLWIPEARWSTMHSAFPPALNPFYIFLAANALLWGVAAALLSARFRSRRRTDRRTAV